MVLQHNWSSTWTHRLREMHRLEAVVVKGWSEMAESPPSTLRRTSCNIQTEFMRKSGACSRSIGIGKEDMILPGIYDPQNLGQISD